MKIPRSIKVGGVTYRVKRGTREDHEEAYGITSHKHAYISLDPELDAEREAETLLHELLHCAIYKGGLVEFFRHNKPLTEEEVVQGISDGLFQIIKDNKLDFNEPPTKS